MSGWGAGYPGVPSEVAKKARAGVAADDGDERAGVADEPPQEPEAESQDEAPRA